MSKRASEEVIFPTSSQKRTLETLGNSNTTMDIDENLHSRQLAVYGRDAMKRMAASKVLICGANGLGVEIAKNVILAGLNSVVIMDDKTVEETDLSCQFYLTSDDAKHHRNRAAACRDKLQELNPSVAVSYKDVDLSEDEAYLKDNNFNVLVGTNFPLAKALRVDAICRCLGIAFIWARTRGVFASVFTDFGDNFLVHDVDGEDPLTGIVANILEVSPEGTALVTCVEDERLQFEEGMLVTFSEVQGMETLNSHRPILVTDPRPHSFRLTGLDPDQDYGRYSRGGIVTQVKLGKTLHFKPLAQSLSSPGEILMSDFSKFDRPPQLHLGFAAVDAFEAKHGRSPAPASSADAAEVLALASALNAAASAVSAETKVDSVDEALLTLLAHNARSEIAPMAAFFGGFVGQEIVKALSGKFHPLNQWLLFDSCEALPDYSKMDPSEFTISDEDNIPRRYSDQVAVFGKTLQRKLAMANVFLVGAGALGCEFLKNFAMMGCCCASNESDGAVIQGWGGGGGGLGSIGEEEKTNGKTNGKSPANSLLPASSAAASLGMLTVTDDDTIERSNLSRQFLFRDKDIGGAKSEIAAAAAAKLNPHLRVQALQNRVGLETENLFNHPFWDNLTIVVNALDNVSARLYVDTRCVYHRKPLLESGTLGPKCNTQVVIPDMTENYGASRDPPERQAPMCTVHSFPHNIDHCLAWARSEFEGMLEQAPSEANAFLSNPEEVAKKLLEAADGASRQQLERVVEVLLDNRCSSFEDCVAWARLRFEDYFRSKILQLIHTFPEDAVTSTGLPFWSAPKRFPKALVFDSEDEVHASLVAAAARLKAQVHGVELPAWAMQDDVKIAQLALAVPVAEFVPKIGERIETDPKATAADAAAAGGGGQDDQALIENLLARLHAALANGVISAAQPLTAIQFEKDDDTNHHMAMIAGLANMRARCYGIAEVDRLKAKLIAGRIIPAIATATACATGLVCLELYKVLQGDKPIEAYRNSFVNLALPLMAMAEPMKMAVTKHGETLKWTLWDRWILKGDVTVQEVIDWLEEKGIIAGSISAGTALLYCNIFPRHADRVGKRVSELIETVGKVQLPKGKDVVDIIVACEDEEGNDVDVPQISIHFRNV